MIKIVLVGFGVMGQNHFRVLRKLKHEVEIVAVIDSDLQKLEQLPDDYCGQKLHSIEQIKNLPDAAVIASPTSFHFEHSLFFLQNGIAVFLEKPITADLQQADKLIKLAEEKRVVFAVNHIERCNPAVNFILQQEGKPLFADIQRLGSFSLRSLDVDVLQDLMIHDIDIVLKIETSALKKIHGVGVAVISDKIDLANVRLEFSSGFVANITASRVSQGKTRKLRLFRQGAYYSADYQKQSIKILRLKNNQFVEEMPDIVQQEPLMVIWEKFVQSIKDKKNYAVSALDARNALKVVNQIRQELKIVRD